VGDIFTVTGRVGVVADKVLIYGKAGYANANVDLSVSTAPGGSSFKDDGWVYGGGLEYRLRRSLVLGVEYSYYDLGSGSVPNPAGVGRGDLDNLRFQTVTARLSILLDRSPTATPMK
jgi:opacity protein-like surface antigen